MATYTIYGDAADTEVISQNAAYATAREGAGAVTAEPATGAAVGMGQTLAAAVYYIYQAPMAFDTSVVPAGAATALFSAVGSGTIAGTRAIEGFAYDWGVAVEAADFRSGTALTTLPRVCVRPAAAYSDGVRYEFDDVAMVANLNLSGMTRLVFAGADQRNNVAPTVDERMFVKSADTAGTTDDPRLVVETPAAFRTSFNRLQRRSRVRYR